MNPTPLLLQAEALVQQHQALFAPQIADLQTQIHDQLHHLQQEEQALVAAQAQQLAQIRQQLATDARVLLNTSELHQLVAQIQALDRDDPWATPAPHQPDPNPLAWQLAQLDLRISICDYEPVTDPDAYDDERTHTTEGYRVTIYLQQQRRSLDVVVRRVYSPVEQQTYTLAEELEDEVEPELSEWLEELDFERVQVPQLGRELSYLVVCAAGLLALTPGHAQLQYPMEASA